MEEYDVEKLVKEKLAKFDLIPEWKFKLDKAKKRGGSCQYTRKTITLSRYHVTMNSDAEILDTILHEIAHALVGPGHGHDDVWKKKCIEIGAKPIRCLNEVVELPEGNYKATCKECKKTFSVHRKVKRSHYCLKCGPVKGLLNFENFLDIAPTLE